MDAVEEGILAVVTNHSWIYNPSFRGMRQSLLTTFQEIHVIDLHGSSKPKESPPGGVVDQNVFDIMKGVAITIFVRKRKLERVTWFGDVWGSRLHKYDICAEKNYSQLASKRIYPASPYYFVSPHEDQRKSPWDKFYSLMSIFSIQSAGVLTARDSLNVGFNGSELLKRLRRFASLDVEEARKAFELGDDKRDWSVKSAQQDLLTSQFDEKHLREISYRPFDSRVVYYTGKSKGLIGQPAKPLADAADMCGVVLGTIRRVEEGSFRHAIVLGALPDGHSVSSKEMTHAFPLYVPTKAGKSQENFSQPFRAFLDERYDHHCSPEEILGYIYSILYAPTYRARYAEFLRIEFPRVPFPKDVDQFEKLSRLGLGSD